MKLLKLIIFLAVVGFFGSAVYAQSQSAKIDLATLPAEQRVGEIEPVAVFNGPMLTGVTVSQSGRIFVNFPKWGDRVEYTVAEVRNGQTEL